MNARERALYFAAVCLGLFSIGVLLLAFARHAEASTQIPIVWDGAHFATTTDTSACAPGGAGFSVQDDPITSWGNYAPPDVSPTFTFNLPTQTYNISAIQTQAIANGNTSLHFKLTCTDSGFAEALYGKFSLVSGNFVVDNPPNSIRTGITIVQPTQGTSTASTTLDIDLSYLIGDDLSTFSIDGSIPSRIGISLVLQSTLNGSQSDLGTDWNIASTTGTHTYATSTVAAQGDYTLIAKLVGDYGFVPPPSGCTPFPPFTTCLGTNNVNTISQAFAPTFSLANGTFPLLAFQVGSTTSRNGLATTTCDAFHLGGCFQNALAFLFFPSPDILNQFSFLWSLIQNKPPFGYVSQTIIGLRSLNSDSTPVFSFGDIPLISSIFTPFRTGLAAILWVGFFIAWYRGRLRHLDI